MKAAPALRQARHEGTLRMFLEARECIARIAAAAAPQLSDGLRHEAQQSAVLAEARVVALQALPPHATETWIAAANLIRALERIEAAISAPEAWAGAPVLVEARYLLGAVDAQAAVAAQLAAEVAKAAEHGRKGGRPSKATRDAAMAGRFEALQRIRRNVARSELYADVGAEFGVAWTTVRDAVLAQKKATKKAPSAD